jgi:conjugative transfer signal peptidase TraF
MRVLALAIVATGGIAISSHVQWHYHLVYNPSESAPRGWYFAVPPANMHVGDYVLVRLPQQVATLAAQRRYLPLNVPLLKHVSAIGGQKVCAAGGSLSIDDGAIVHAFSLDSAGRPLVAWSGCRNLREGEVLLLSTNSDASFDSRYFGPVQRECIVGRAIPLLTW